MTRPRRLFSYVVHHDFGLSPNPKGGYCTLAFCKFREPGQRRRNVVEMAEEGDWVVGTSGKGEQSFGAHGHLIYAMEVTQKLTLRDYFLDPRFTGRAGNRPEFSSHTDMFALVSDHLYYFGRNARPLARRHINRGIERGGRGHKANFTEAFIGDFVGWVTGLVQGVHGEPCGSRPTGRATGLGLSRVTSPSTASVDIAASLRPRRKC